MTPDPGTVPYGLTTAVTDAINGVLSNHPQVTAAILYGSRAKGTFKHGSDIDLCLTGPELTLAALLVIETELDDLLLPYKIDLSLLCQIDNAALRQHITRDGVLLYQR
jgi:predicted nucleotidyltransferase